ncbi:MAG TPA: Stk1 family PASTA domain-containing Ser/Thr kinase [Nocardioidaceae bacterium]|nr:Stk1 family PASTA domain-containing Ser/Thr kinase [Nocardioidaceae bacterium]
MDKTAADPLIGRLLDGRYRVGPRIARGGMATVYEALDERLDRPCAVKVMHQNMGDDHDFAARFVREARSAARLSHPNVVSVFDQGDDDGTLFLVMEYIPGHTLRDVIRKEAPMAPGKALALLDPVLAALAAAHQSGMIHRDVKPENVLLAPDGRIKVADFGLARAISAETQHTATGGVLIGTVSYLAPELVVDGKADARADVYSAGVLLFEMLTARKPHEGDTAIQVAYKHVHEDVPAPSSIVPGTPPYVDALVARATARDRDHRPSDARVLQQLARRVKAAIDAGVYDDPELTADLALRRGVGTDTSDIDYYDDDSAPTVATPIGEVQAVLASAPLRQRPPETRTVRPAEPARDPREPQRRPAVPVYRSSKRGPVLLVAVLVLAVVAGLAGWWFGIGRYTTTPGVIDLPVAQAQQRIEDAGLTFEVTAEEYSETVTKGAVIGTDPAAGDRILQDGTVHATVSLGPERYAVPTLRGLDVDTATERLEANNLTVGRITKVFNEEIAEGIVIRSDPAAKTEMRPDAAVALVVSKGPKPIEIKDWTGKKIEPVQEQLTEMGLDVVVTQAYDEKVPEGRIISQDPPEGATLYKGEKIEFVVSQGPPLVEVPNVVRSGVEDATETLEAAGFVVDVQQSDSYIGLGFVFEQSPEGGELLPKGSTVTIYLV